MPIVCCDKEDCFWNEDGFCENDMIDIEILECTDFEKKERIYCGIKEK